MGFGRADNRIDIEIPDRGETTIHGVGDAIRKSGIPVATICLVLLLGLIYAAEIGFTPGREPTLSRLAAFGGSAGSLVLEHRQYWRVLTACFLHANQSHLVGNSIALFLAGVFLERLIGPIWLLAIFLITGIGGNLLGLMVNPAGTIAVGASGGIVGLFAFTLFAILRDDDDDRIRRVMYLCGRVLISAVIPSANVDTAGHIGGALTGGLVFLALSPFWDDSDAEPPHGLAVLCCAPIAVLVAQVLGLLLP